MMSTFSSVVRKPGQKIIPKATPRRVGTRHNVRSNVQSSTTSNPEPRDHHEDLLSELQSQPEINAAAAPESTNTGAANNGTRQNHTHSHRQQSPLLDLADRNHALKIQKTGEPYKSSENPSDIADRRRSQRRHGHGPNESRTRLPNVTEPAAQATDKVTVRSQNERISSSAGAQVSNGLPTSSLPVTGSSGKKRKITPVAIPAATTSQVINRDTRLSEENSTNAVRRISIGFDQTLRPADELLQNATTQAAAVSTLANRIDTRTRLLRPRRSQSSLDDLGALGALHHRSLAREVIPVRVGVADAAAAVSQKNTKKRRRRGTPENAAEYEINATEVQMGDLTKDTRLGKPSELGQRLREKWPEVQRRRKDQLAMNRTQVNERGKHGKKIERKTGLPEVQLEQITTEIPVPQMAIVNGVITVTTESREVAFGAGLERAMAQDAENALEDDKIYRYVNQGTFGKSAGASRGFKWDEEKTELFFQGLRMFGTDFMMIANLFPGMTRKHIKLKYVKEERSNLARIRESLATRQDIALDEYAKLTNKEFEDPKKVQEELEAEEKRLRAEDKKRRAQEGFVTVGDETVVQSMEESNEEPVVTAEDADNDFTESNTRSQPDASSTLKDTIPSKKRPRKPKDSAKTRQSKKGRRPLEGVEERIGPIDEVERGTLL